MKKLLALFIFCSSTLIGFSQSVGIGTNTPNSNAALEIRSSNKGLLIPRLSTASKNAMPNVAKGMMVYDYTLSAFYCHDGNKWRAISEKNADSLVSSGFINSPATTANMASIGSNATTTAISLKDEKKYYNVDNKALTYMLINSVKEQQKQIETQQQQIQELKTILNQLLKK